MTEDKQIIYLSPYDLVPYPDNIRKHDETDLAVIKKSIEEYGFQDPVTVDPYMTIIEGHGRVMVAKELGIERIPVIISDLEGDLADGYRLVHNKTGEIAGYDMDKYDRVINELVERCQFDAEGYMFKLPENPMDDLLDNILGENSGDNGSGSGRSSEPQHKLIITCNNDDDIETILARLSDMDIIVQRVN